ncbi:unnamed protein product, partial [Lota lota]
HRQFLIRLSSSLYSSAREEMKHKQVTINSGAVHHRVISWSFIMRKAGSGAAGGRSAADRIPPRRLSSGGGYPRVKIAPPRQVQTASPRVIQMDPGSQQQNLLFARHSEHVGHHSHAVVQLTAGKHVHLDLQLLGMGRGRSAVGPEPWVVAVPTDDPEGPSLFICSGGGAPTHVASRSPAPALPHVFP